ncbi:hypothetical protein PHYBLDRAFT_140708 [Phycomyces blakesleeanus NRRL 1555(-)]|uniref:Uncharacterized protein n=1 Tax=Phycomyces blakesleeanus (strain ATCC 8743b / DSM 1359 / FGSC 10004 / NBRC 33097 / NRRL 1555) TaxID=763407 RepID=A0A167PWB6_PHYB8|nr:hypothetical protein PHYBLDRAFT_140708 [Phycomyces blakesleeanus NRRL 1555(-)]OAD78648.1 hypothetical protein PHYBLDRAFT_140708 [Phycomyces blakesleeanus NRRL 1555(-)]|eukprot:XP_018296688.1 hypothetical protein PHYBLDRAFT_140708 [Phycomyces blakesleeanus NRRL 1555(-)]
MKIFFLTFTTLIASAFAAPYGHTTYGKIGSDGKTIGMLNNVAEGGLFNDNSQGSGRN